MYLVSVLLEEMAMDLLKLAGEDPRLGGDSDEEEAGFNPGLTVPPCDSKAQLLEPSGLAGSRKNNSFYFAASSRFARCKIGCGAVCAIVTVFLAAIVGCVVGLLIGESLGRRSGRECDVAKTPLLDTAEGYNWGDKVVVRGTSYDVLDVFSSKLDINDIRDSL